MTFAASYSSALSGICKPPAAAAFGGAPAAIRTGSGGTGQAGSVKDLINAVKVVC